MKMLPVQLSLNPPLGLWSDVLWRCPPAPPSQLAELKTQLPPTLPSDPKLWGREDVTMFLKFCEREFDLPAIDLELFKMNGKALCLLTRADFGHRCPGAGDVVHNVLQMLIIESHMMQWHLPNSPVTPTSRFPLSPHSLPSTPTWPSINASENPFSSQQIHHFMPPNSVTLSPPPSVDSQASSPPQNNDQIGTSCKSNLAISSLSNISTFGTSISAKVFNPNSISGTSSNQSDSDEDSCNEAANNYSRSSSAVAVTATDIEIAQCTSSPPTTPVLKEGGSQSISQQLAENLSNTWPQSQEKCKKLQSGNRIGGSASEPTTPSYIPVKREFLYDCEQNTKNIPMKREFFPENAEPNTNGRLLWDFLQQLLNDRNQKYSDLIAWKCRDTGVFKIVDPAGLAKLWGIQKNHLSMNYDKMSRALRYYYRVNILRKVQGERHCYQFLRNPTELKNIKNISLLRQTIAGSAAAVGGSTSGNISAQSSCNQSNTSVHCSSAWPMNHQGISSTSGLKAASANQQSSHSSSQSSQSLGFSPLSSSPAAAGVAAAAAYGPPPTSPLFMHAINGAFHYMSTSNNKPPNSPVLPSTPSEKIQFTGLSLETNGYDSIDEMKPTDLSMAGSNEKRQYPLQSSDEQCYPLIRNADGLTTIKLIRYSKEDIACEAEEPVNNITSDDNRSVNGDGQNIYKHATTTNFKN